MSKRKFLVSVIGGHECDQKNIELAEKVGEIIASEGATLVSGGREGIMKAVSRGAKKAGGLTVGIIPGENKEDANEFIDIVITSGLGYSRNAMVAGTADLVVAFPGKYGTLSEIGFALNAKKEVYGFGTWSIPGVKELDSPNQLKGIISERIK